MTTPQPRAQFDIALIDVLFLGIAILSIMLHTIIFTLTQVAEPFLVYVSSISLGLFLGTLIFIGLHKQTR